MPIIERCTHGAKNIASCATCKAVYRTRERLTNRALYLWRAAKSRAHKHGVPFTITTADVKIPAHCPVLGIALDDSDRDHTPSLDEVVQGLGYVPRNVCVISGRANRMKSDGTPNELKAVARYARLRSLFALNGTPSSW